MKQKTPKTFVVTTLTLDKPYVNIQSCKDWVFKAPDGFTIKSKMVPKNDIQELYSHAKIDIDREDTSRVTRSKRVTIGGISLKIVEPDKLQYRSSTKQEAGSTYRMALRIPLKNAGYIKLSSVCKEEVPCSKPKTIGRHL